MQFPQLPSAPRSIDFENKQIPTEQGIAKREHIRRDDERTIDSFSLFPDSIADVSMGTSESAIPVIIAGGRLYIGTTRVLYAP